MKSKKKAIFSVVLLLTTPLCMAEPYFGIGIGQSSTEELSEDDVMTLETGFNGGEVLDSFSQENSDTAFRFFAGYDLSQKLSLEAGYINYGEYSFVTDDSDKRYNPTATSYQHHVEAKAETSGFYISVLPKIHYSTGISINPKLGILIWKSSGNLKVTTDTTYASQPDVHTSYTRTLSNNGVDPMIGIGMSYDRYAIEYERAQIDQSNIDLIMLSIRL